MKRKGYKGIHAIYLFFFVLFLWQGIALVIDKSFFPPLSDILLNIVMTFWGKIAAHAFYSLRRIMTGILLTLLAGVPLGILMGYLKKVDFLFSPLLYFSYPVPKMALLPIVMLLFGLGETAKIVMIFLITFFPVVVNIRDDVKNIPQEVFYPVLSLGAGHFQIIKEIILPGVVPVALTSLRLGFGTAISVLFFTENFGTEYGLGYFIMDAWMRVNYIEMYSGIFILSMIGLILFVAIDALENILCPWRDDR